MMLFRDLGRNVCLNSIDTVNVLSTRKDKVRVDNSVIQPCNLVFMPEALS